MYEIECNKCGSKSEIYQPEATGYATGACKCGGLMEIVWSKPAMHIWVEYTSRNIKPDGSPVTVTSKAHENQLLKQYGLQKADAEM